MVKSMAGLSGRGAIRLKKMIGLLIAVGLISLLYVGTVHLVQQHCTSVLSGIRTMNTDDPAPWEGLAAQIEGLQFWVFLPPCRDPIKQCVSEAAETAYQHCVVQAQNVVKKCLEGKYRESRFPLLRLVMSALRFRPPGAGDRSGAWRCIYDGDLSLSLYAENDIVAFVRNGDVSIWRMRDASGNFSLRESEREPVVIRGISCAQVLSINGTELRYISLDRKVMKCSTDTKVVVPLDLGIPGRIARLKIHTAVTEDGMAWITSDDPRKGRLPEISNAFDCAFREYRYSFIEANGDFKACGFVKSCSLSGHGDDSTKAPRKFWEHGVSIDGTGLAMYLFRREEPLLCWTRGPSFEDRDIPVKVQLACTWANAYALLADGSIMGTPKNSPFFHPIESPFRFVSVAGGYHSQKLEHIFYLAAVREDGKLMIHDGSTWVEIGQVPQ